MPSIAVSNCGSVTKHAASVAFLTDSVVFSFEVLSSLPCVIGWIMAPKDIQDIQDLIHGTQGCIFM